MLKLPGGRAKVSPINQEHFDKILSAIWWKKGRRSRFGMYLTSSLFIFQDHLFGHYVLLILLKAVLMEHLRPRHKRRS